MFKPCQEKKGYKKKLSKGVNERCQLECRDPAQQPVEPRTIVEGRTTYMSRNNHEGSTFVAETSGDSPLAARLLKIALQNQPEDWKPRPKSREGLEGQSQRTLTVHGEPMLQPSSTNSPPHTSPTQQSSYPSSIQQPPNVSPTQYPAYASSASQPAYISPREIDAQHPHHYPNPTGPANPQQGRQHPQASDSHYLTRIDPVQPPSPWKVYRYEHDGQIEYFKKSPGGELHISTPSESQEAKVMAYAATQLSAKQECPRDQVSSSSYTKRCWWGWLTWE